MSLDAIPFNDVVQYALIAALFIAAVADRSAHRAYIREMTRQHNEMLKVLGHICAKLDRDSGAP